MFGKLKRLMLAAMAMQGILSGYYANPKDVLSLDGSPMSRKAIARDAFAMADEMLKQEGGGNG